MQLLSQFYSIIKKLHVSGIFSVNHQEFSTLHSALVSFKQVSDDRFQTDSGWNYSSILILLFYHRHLRNRVLNKYAETDIKTYTYKLRSCWTIGRKYNGKEKWLI